MESDMEYIDRYFQTALRDEEKKAFENKVLSDPDFAEQVAFYISAKQAAKDQLAQDRKLRFKEIYLQHVTDGMGQKQKIMRQLWPYAAAAAAVIGLVLCWYLLVKPASPQQLADDYITQHYTTLGITMSSDGEELQKGLNLYNEGNPQQALEEFEKLSILDSGNFEVKKYAGITALRLQQYNKALHYFKLLKDQPGLYANPGTFLQAITLLKRDLPGDEKTARTLLQEVVQNDLEGARTATQWLKKW